jgi:transposase
MRLPVTETQRLELEAAAAAEKGVRRWRRHQAVLLLAEGQAPAAVARTLRCSRASVYAWAAAWRREGVAGLRDGDHGGGKVKLDAGAEGVLTGRLGEDPQARGYQATGWTVPLLRRELAQAGCQVGTARCAAPCTGSATAGSGRATCWVVPIRPTPKKGGRDRPSAGHARGGWGGLGGR